jgi:hypothetical protein
MNILLIYDCYAPQKMRQSLLEHLRSFQKYSPHDIYYCNYAYGYPSYFSKISFDLVIFHNFFAAQFRWNGLSYEDYLSRLLPVKDFHCPKVLFCQDEFIHMDRIVRFIQEFQISKVFTLAEKSSWEKIYQGVDFHKVQFYQVLTGYLDDDIEEIVTKLLQENLLKEFDLGYRASHVPYWLGRHGQLKITVGEKVDQATRKKGWKTSIKTVNDEEEMLLGLDWLRFLMKCNGTIGVEGGSSILDFDGRISQQVRQYLMQHKKASFLQTESACFAGKDNQLDYRALSPRHFEACVSRTCQILIEGDYSGILKPEQHYIVLKKDFSNLSEALEKFSDPLLRKEIVDRCYEEIVESKKYVYSVFVDRIFSLCLPKIGQRKNSTLLKRNRLREWWLWKRTPIEFLLWRKIKKIVPSSIEHRLKKLRNRAH